MRYMCDAGNGKTWFRFETENEAEAEAALMRHSVDKYFRRYEAAARESYRAPQGVPAFEQAIGLKDHIANSMPLFLTLRADDGDRLDRRRFLYRWWRGRCWLSSGRRLGCRRRLRRGSGSLGESRLSCQNGGPQKRRRKSGAAAVVKAANHRHSHHRHRQFP